MFAYLNQDGTIGGFVEVIPDPILPPDPLPDGYVSPPVIEYREVVDGTKPDTTMPFSAILENPVSAWTITSTQAIKTWYEHIPPIADCREIKKAFLRIAVGDVREAGIPVATAEYGTLIFSTDALPGLLACSHICDLLIRQSASNGNQNINLVIINSAIQQVLVKEVMPIVLSYCTTYHQRNVTLSQKLRAVAQASTVAEISTVN